MNNQDTPVEQITAYRTSDNEIFLDKKLADKHQRAIDRLDRINQFVCQYGWDGMEIMEIVEMLEKHGIELVPLLKK